MHNDVNWAAIKRQAEALAAHAQTTAGTYQAIAYAIRKADDRVATLYPRNLPGLDSGYGALYPDGLVVSLEPDSPAAQAGMRMGDRILLLNGEPPRQSALTGWIDQGTTPQQHLVLWRDGQTVAVSLTPTSGPTAAALPAMPTGRRLGSGSTALGYLSLPGTNGDSGQYATQGQNVIQAIDRQSACGWVIDLRRTESGDIWSYLGAVGPILGEGTVGWFPVRRRPKAAVGLPIRRGALGRGAAL